MVGQGGGSRGGWSIVSILKLRTGASDGET